MEELKVFIIAGEESGDILASEVVAKLKRLSTKKLIIHGIAGKNLKQHKIDSIFPQDDISVMGFIEVLPAIARIINRIKYTVEYIKSFQPDIIITVDSPDFCFRVIKKLRNTNNYNHQTKFVHMVAPTVWAYRKKRAAYIAKLYDLLLVLLPFEPKYFKPHGLDTKFIGHPLIYKKDAIPKQDLYQKYNIDKNTKIIVLTLGSRNKEIQKLERIYKNALLDLAKTEKDLTIIIPSFPKYKSFLEDWQKDIPFKTIITMDEVEKLEFFKQAFCVIAKSGTNTIEIAKQGSAFMVCYKVNLLTYLLLKVMVYSKYVNLLNIFAHREIVPEYIQYKCTAQNISNQVKKYLASPKLVAKQINQQNKYIGKFLNKDKADPSLLAAQEILSKRLPK